MIYILYLTVVAGLLLIERRIKRTEEIIMASEQDLKAAISVIGTAVSTLGSEITPLQTALDAIIKKLSTAGIPDEDVSALASISTSLGVANVALQEAVAKAAEAAV